jgi:hypothetical protein
VPGLRLNRDAVPVPLDDLLANGQELFAFVEALEQAENFWRPSPMALGGRDRIANGSRVSGAGDTIIGIGGFTAFPRRGAARNSIGTVSCSGTIEAVQNRTRDQHVLD